LKVIRGKQAVVTGAASGIGRAIALGLAGEGASLFLVDINPGGLEEVAQRARGRGVEALTCAADLAARDEVARVARALRNAWETMDILVNCAGISYVGDTVRMTPDQWERLLGVNLRAPLRLTLDLLPDLLSRPQSHILNVCSFGGLVEHWNETAYCLTKFALVGFSESLRVEYGRHGLGVTALCPGMVRTGLEVMRPPGEVFEFPAEALRLLTTPEKVAETAIDAIRRDRGIVVGAVTPHLLWLVRRISPRLADWVHVRIMDSMRRSMSRQRRRGTRRRSPV
jgi:short-subunit dehydrogenase